METTLLLKSEEKYHETLVESESFTLTNKRLLYFNNENNKEGFIGINELRGAEIKDVKVEYRKFEIKNGRILGLRICLVLLLLFGIYMVFTTHTWEPSEVISMIGISMFFGAGIATIISTIIVGLLKLYSNSTKETVNRVYLSIRKIDNNLFFGKHYDLKYRESLKLLSEEINNLIYK